MHVLIRSHATEHGAPGKLICVWDWSFPQIRQNSVAFSKCTGTLEGTSRKRLNSKVMSMKSCAIRIRFFGQYMIKTIDFQNDESSWYHRVKMLTLRRCKKNISILFWLLQLFNYIFSYSFIDNRNFKSNKRINYI